MFKPFITVCWVTLICVFCCFYVFVACERNTIERTACARLLWEGFLICGFWPACHLLEAIHELSVLASFCKTLIAKNSADAVVQKEVCGFRVKGKTWSGVCKHRFTENIKKKKNNLFLLHFFFYFRQWQWYQTCLTTVISKMERQQLECL